MTDFVADAYDDAAAAADGDDGAAARDANVRRWRRRGLADARHARRLRPRSVRRVLTRALADAEIDTHLNLIRSTVQAVPCMDLLTHTTQS